ncbi:MAG: ABC transporter substrate-binding protein [Chloroflexota bacterium]
MSRKIMIVLGLLVVASMILAACGPAETPAPTAEPPAPVETDEPAAPAPTEAPTAVPTEPPFTTTRTGTWMDEVSMSVVDSGSAVTQISAGAIDIYGGNLATPQDLQAIRDAGLMNSEQYGLYYELTFNPSGPVFEGTGKLNPFAVQNIREAMNWLVDRDYLNQEIYGGVAIPKFLPISAGFPDYARYVDLARAVEAKYAYNFDKANEIITTEMEALGAVKNADGKWTYNDELVTLIILIRTDSDGTRVPQGDYVSNQLEAIGFTMDRQYKTSSEASPLWVLGNPADGLWHIYTGAWGVSGISRSEGDNFQFFYSPKSAYGFSPLWQAYTLSEEADVVSEALALNDFNTFDERRELFAQAMDLIVPTAYRVWLIDGKGFSPWKPGLAVSYDLAAGIDINPLWSRTLRFVDEAGLPIEGGTVKWGNSDLFVDPPNPVAGSNWTYDSQWQNATGDYAAMGNPFTGNFIPNRLERAEVTVLEGLPVINTTDWVTLDFAAQIDVPADAWIDWDPAAEVFKTVGEVYPDGLTAKRKSVVYYPSDLYNIKWHDGSNMSVADFIMPMIMTFAPGTEGSPIFDESQVGALESFKSSFKGFRIVSADPLTIEYYSDVWYFDADWNVAGMWPEYGYGNASWHMIAVSNLAEAANELAYSADKADALSSETAPVEWMSYVGGPSLEILAKFLDQAAAESYIPFAPTLGAYITADEAAARYANLQQFYADRGHFWVGTGPMILDQVFFVEKTATLVRNPDYPDLADKWLAFSAPKLAEAEIDGAGRVTIGAEAAFDVFVSYQGEAYPADEIDNVKYLLFGADGALIEVGEAELVADGQYVVTLSAETTGKLAAGAAKLEVAVVSKVVSVPSFAAFEFVAE